MGVQISIRVSGDVTILDLWGRATSGADSELLSSHVRELVANGVRKLLLNLADLTQLDSSGISTIVGSYVSLTIPTSGPRIVDQPSSLRLAPTPESFGKAEATRLGQLNRGSLRAGAWLCISVLKIPVVNLVCESLASNHD